MLLYIITCIIPYAQAINLTSPLMLTALLGGIIRSILSPIPPSLRTVNFSIGRSIQHAFKQGNCWMYDTALTIDNNESDTLFEDIISHILSQDNVMLSVKSSGAVCEFIHK